MVDHLIRKATPQDVYGVARVKQAVWPEQTSDPNLVAASLEASDHFTVVAEERGNVVGFADGFMTQSGEGKRWEVDLLAVKPESRGSRLGEALVRASCAAGYQWGAKTCRALIQVDNVASQITFSRSGFYPQEPLHHLYVAADGALKPTERCSGILIRVVTMNYLGVWLESQYTSIDLLAAKSAIGHDGVQIAGAVIPAALEEAFMAAERLGYVKMGIYQWWSHRSG